MDLQREAQAEGHENPSTFKATAGIPSKCLTLGREGRARHSVDDPDVQESGDDDEWMPQYYTNLTYPRNPVHRYSIYCKCVPVGPANTDAEHTYHPVLTHARPQSPFCWVVTLAIVAPAA
ncbi:hypothetical protein SUNI508_12668 [Seiridium unicorne]|uniref:Uncharacterized protein n=1 Tax=Seiridium unicorne TaxID=138068 RepID=A0ABR2VHS7_9PEZI